MVEKEAVYKFTAISVLISVTLNAILGIGTFPIQSAQSQIFSCVYTSKCWFSRCIRLPVYSFDVSVSFDNWKNSGFSGAVFNVVCTFLDKFKKDVITTAFSITTWTVAYIATLAPVYVSAPSGFGNPVEIAAMVFAGIGAAQSFGFGKMLIDSVLCEKNSVEPSAW